MQYEVIKRADGRYVITNTDTQEVIDNAQGYLILARSAPARAGGLAGGEAHVALQEPQHLLV